MDHNASEERDLESGGTGHEDETSRSTISGNKQAKNMVGRLMSGLLGYSGSANGESSASTDSKLGTSSENPHDNIELLTDKNSGQSVELMPLLEKKPVKDKRKTSFRKASKPPRPPKGPTLDVSDVKLVMEISELAMKKRARIQRIKALKKMNAEMSYSSPSSSSLPSSPSSPSSSSTSNSSLAAMVVTLLFFVLIVFQGIYSRNSSSASFQGSPEPATAVNGLISIQLYNSTPAS